MKAIIDAEVYLYRAAVSSEFEFEFQEDWWTYMCDHGEAKKLFSDQIERVEKAAANMDILLVFGDRNNFRYGVYPKYKNNRRNYRRAAGYRALIEWASSTWNTVQLANVEGDDVVGIMHEEGDLIVSRDKDLLTIPGVHLTEDSVQLVTREQADYNFFLQALTGDQTDGYPGCPGYGPVAAKAVLQGAGSNLEMWQRVVAAYEKKGLDADYALSQARCARILRRGEYNFERNSPLLWSPSVL
jgi:DNA polymerase I